MWPIPPRVGVAPSILGVKVFPKRIGEGGGGSLQEGGRARTASVQIAGPRKGPFSPTFLGGPTEKSWYPYSNLSTVGPRMD